MTSIYSAMIEILLNLKRLTFMTSVSGAIVVIFLNFRFTQDLLLHLPLKQELPKKDISLIFLKSIKIEKHCCEVIGHSLVI